MTHTLVDFHCHLDLFPDFEGIIKEAERSRIYTLAVTTTPRAWQRNYELTKGLKYVRPALGLHPQLVGKNTSQELILWEKNLIHATYIGEVGLDAGPDFFHTLDQQKKVFARILTLCAKAGGKILSVHAVRSVDIVLDMIETLMPADRGTVVFHWFTGTPSQACKAIELGCYFSINTPMLNSKRGELLLQLIPSDCLLTETDGPFTTSKSEKPNRPKDVARTVELLSKQRHISQDEMSKQITMNFRRLLSIHST